ncbi:MAG: extracellular solute-binding protein [Chloroflexi bacterium]|nr:extracellular solute-binding protein [Chloroflexota bacterium]
MMGQTLDPRQGDRQMSRRRAFAHAATIAAAGVLSACQLPGQAGEETRPEAKEVTLTYVTDWSGGVRGEWIKAAIPKFIEENPKIKVQVDNWGGEVTVVALANAAAGTLQDVMLGSNDVYIQLVRAGDMKDISPVLKSLKVKMDDVIHVPSTIIYQGKQYGMPFQFGPIIMMMNKTLFKNAGAALPAEKTTYPELLELLRKVSKPAEKVYGMAIGGSPGAWGQWLPFVWGYGGDRWTPDLKRSLIGEPGSVEGLQFFVDMMHRHEVAAPIDEKGGLPSGVSFNNGNVAVAFATAPGTGQDRTIAGKFEWDLMYHPIGPRVNKRNVFVNDQANTVTGTAAKRGVFEQAVRFVVWCAASKTAQDLVAEIGPNAMPVLKSVANSPKYLAGPPASMKIIPDQAPNFRDPQTFIGWNQWRNDVVAVLLPAFAGKKAVKDAAADAARAGDLVLAKIPR